MSRPNQYATHRTIRGKQLTELLDKDIISFIYKKKDGDIRVTRGTRNKDLIRRYNVDPEGPEHDFCIAYYDYDKHDWRACREDNIIAVGLMESVEYLAAHKYNGDHDRAYQEIKHIGDLEDIDNHPKNKEQSIIQSSTPKFWE